MTTRNIAHHSMLPSDRPLVLTTFQLKTSISLDAQSPDAITAGLPGMVKF